MNLYTHNRHTQHLSFSKDMYAYRSMKGITRVDINLCIIYETATSQIVFITLEARHIYITKCKKKKKPNAKRIARNVVYIL